MIRAREEFEKALELDPDDVTTNFWYGLTLARWGYQRSGVERMEHALAVDPMVPNVMRWRGVMYLRYGDVDGAEQYLKRAQATGLSLAGRELAEIAARRGDFELARRLWLEGAQIMVNQLAGDLRPGFSDRVSAGLFGGSAVERERAVAAIEAFLATQPKNIAGVTPMWLAQLGQGARAMEVERIYVKTDNSDFLVYVFSPAGKSLRQLSEFPEYLKAKGFPMLWDKYGPPDVCGKSDKGDYVCE
jgi:tetratricopeptide (TPR) repeat protein